MYVCLQCLVPTELQSSCISDTDPLSLTYLMLRKKGSELSKDREVLLDLEHTGESYGAECYGSLENGGFIPPRYVSAFY